jgi:hypothetical protein
MENIKKPQIDFIQRTLQKICSTSKEKLQNGYIDYSIVIKNTKKLVAILTFASLIICINKNNL